MRPLVFALSSGLLACAQAFALQWEATELKITPAPLDDRAVTVFRFHNDNTTRVTITHVQADCGCTVPTLEKRDYAPGESGEIRAEFAFGERVGLQRKTITVVTNERTLDNYTLSLEVDIPRLFDVQPMILLWREQDPRETKAVTIRALQPEVIRPIAVEPRDNRFKVELKPVAEEPGVFHVLVTPPATESDVQGAFVVKTNAPESSPRVITFYGRVF